ncbi:MAG: 50S ribosomal protein L24e [Nanoarchaeota archaeon]|nr:50S ribosomal protein L24e [Nanoarchaeota archaeon]
MPKCSFCGENIPKGTGKIVVKKDGKVLYFDKSKCEKNMLKLKRKPRDFKWTASYEKGG